MAILCGKYVEFSGQFASQVIHVLHLMGFRCSRALEAHAFFATRQLGIKTMQRSTINTVATICLLAISTTSVQAVEWADKMFPVKSHDFGSVAVAAKTEFRFPFKNLYVEDIHVSSVRASCNCTTPIIENHTLKTGETGYIRARFNTGSFYGKKGATLTVVIDKPFYAEVQLRVDGYIRRDIVFSPGQVDFGSVVEGRPSQTNVDLSYAGRSDWSVLNIESSDPHVTATYEESKRYGSTVGYKLHVSFDGTAQPGLTRANLVIVTNDRAMPRVPLEVSYDVRPAVIVSPQVVTLGTLKPGEVSNQRLVVRSDKPFLLKNVQAKGYQIDFEAGTEPKMMHVLPLKFTAGNIANAVQQPLIVSTDLPGNLTGTAIVAGQISDK